MSAIRLVVAGALLLAIVAASPLLAQTNPASEIYWTMLHEEAVVEDLKLTPAEHDAYRAVLDPLDLRLFPLRNKPANQANPGVDEIVAQARIDIGQAIKPAQKTRLDKIVLRQLGTRALQQPAVAKQLALSDKQQKTIAAAISEAQDQLAKLREDAAGKPQDELNKQAGQIDGVQRTRVLAALTDAQKQKWSTLIATDFDDSQLGRTRFKAPELVSDAADWRNSPPLTLAGQKGKVVVVHFFACGCINCIHNYPIYQKWHAELSAKGVTLIGIHTPETESERKIKHLESKLKEDNLPFPVLIDNASANWNAWGNSMWPSVYVIDKQGDLRHFWAGELKWQGAKGEEIARDWIDRLLKE